MFPLPILFELFSYKNKNYKKEKISMKEKFQIKIINKKRDKKLYAIFFPEY